MESTVLFTALREFTTGLLNQLLVNLAGQDGQTWHTEFKKFLRRERCWSYSTEPLITLTGKVEIPRMPNDFVASENFVYTLKPEAKRIGINGLGKEFTNWFLDDRRKSRAPFGPAKMTYWTLHETAPHRTGEGMRGVITELGGTNNIEVTLWDIYCLVSAQPADEAGALATNQPNRFYVLDCTNVLRAVTVYSQTHGMGWCITASDIDEKNIRNQRGFRLFRRDTSP